MANLIEKWKEICVTPGSNASYATEQINNLSEEQKKNTNDCLMRS